MTGQRTFPHGISCPPETWAAIKARARERRMTVSRFLVACALHGDATTGYPLVLSEDEQRKLVQAVDRVETGLRKLQQPLPGTRLALSEAVTVLYLLRGLDQGLHWEARNSHGQPITDPDADAGDGSLGMAPSDDRKER